ncbi:DUF1987 domain-containing protein [Marinoscillum sp. MHG1-6]|uniref:DUF1987 domain-containing protein n=1 Tax=Marinoscillum sp. MHG1-6 TaxID=2959627 RepID=UPI0021581BAB|nr:DUF1987 domain-containing protein [Marinoscillum sp. MHG1-6]
MLDVLIQPTRTTPYVKMDSEESIIVFTGRSSPENSLEFYHPLIQNIPKLFSQSSEPLTVEMSLSYFNTSSSKCLFDLFKTLKVLSKSGKEVVINWHYDEDDEDMLETGEDYSDLLDLEFNFIEEDEVGHVSFA